MITTRNMTIAEYLVSSKKQSLFARKRNGGIVKISTVALQITMSVDK
jgi:hypothetical protein